MSETNISRQLIALLLTTRLETNKRKQTHTHTHTHAKLTLRKTQTQRWSCIFEYKKKYYYRKMRKYKNTVTDHIKHSKYQDQTRATMMVIIIDF